LTICKKIKVLILRNWCIRTNKYICSKLFCSTGLVFFNKISCAYQILALNERFL
jgi:hypothetical protein